MRFPERERERERENQTLVAIWAGFKVAHVADSATCKHSSCYLAVISTTIQAALLLKNTPV